MQKNIFLNAGSVSSATRPAGKYTLKWDGKDNQGKLVKPGKYTVFIEASREHGTYQLMRQEMDFNGAPKQFNLTGNVEIASASLDYCKRVVEPPSVMAPARTTRNRCVASG